VLGKPKLSTAPVLADPGRARHYYSQHGFCVVSDVVEPASVREALAHVEAVVDGHYETGVAPVARWTDPEDRSGALVKIDQPHYCDRTLLGLLRHPGVARWAKAISVASFIQVWAVQLLYKPSGGATRSSVGWHQDHLYWKDWVGGDTFTLWLALSDVGPASGPVRFVDGSHRWGPIDGGDFFSDDTTPMQSGTIAIPRRARWREIQACMAAGDASLHSPLVLHGSGANTSGMARIGLAIHFRTEHSTVMPGAPAEYPAVLDNPERSPVIAP